MSVARNRPGRELRKDLRAAARRLVEHGGYSYERRKRSHSILRPPDPTDSPIVLPLTPGTRFTLINLQQAVNRRKVTGP